MSSYKLMTHKIDIIIGEEWRDIEGYEGLYQISSLGRIKSMPRTFTNKRNKTVRIREGHIVIPKFTKQGYNRIELSNNGVRKMYHVHRVVGKAFIPNPEEKPYINHIDGNPLNNAVSNLEWCTQKENIEHAYRIGLSKKVGKGCFHPASIPILIIDTVKKSVTSIGSLKLGAKYLGIGHSTICRYVKGQVISKRYKFELVYND